MVGLLAGAVGGGAAGAAIARGPESVTTFLTGLLVAITGYYAWQNQRMVSEMRATRELAILPKLALTLEALGPTYVLVRVVNIGQGAAQHVDVTLTFEPKADAQREERRWKSHLMAPGQASDFFPPDPVPGHIPSIDAFVLTCERVTLVGTMEDLTGRAHLVGEELGDLTEWSTLLTNARERYLDDPAHSLAKHTETLAKHSKVAADALKKIAVDWRPPRPGSG